MTTVNRRGFAPIIVILIVVIAAAIAYGAWRWNNRRAAPTFTPHPALTVINCSKTSPIARSVSYSNDQEVNGSKIYQNNVYGYSFSYPKNWFVDDTYANDGFTPRGEDGHCVGGDLNVLNYKGDFSVASGNVMPSDFDTINLSIYGIDPNMTVDQFVSLFFKYYATVQAQHITLGGIPALKIVATAPDNTGEPMTQNWALGKKGNEIFLFGLGDDAHQTVYQQIFSTFKFTN